MCVVCVAGEVDSVRAEYGTRDTHGEAFTLLHERTFTSPGPWPLINVRSFNQHLQTHATRARSEQDKAHPQGGSEASDMTAYIELIEASGARPLRWRATERRALLACGACGAPCATGKRLRKRLRHEARESA